MGGWSKNGKGGGNQQRFQKYRSDTVVPGITGVLVSVDPAGTGKAIREMKLLLESFKPDSAVAAEKKAAAEANNTTSAACSSTAAINDAPAGGGGAFSLAAMLASELDSFRRPARPDAVVANVTGAVDDDATDDKAAARGGNNNKDPSKKPPKRLFRQEWFSSLETNCKGYILMNIPKPAKGDAEAEEEEEEGQQLQDTEVAEGVATTADGSMEEALGDEPPAKQARTEPSAAATATAGGYPSDARFRVNPYVTETIEALMTSLSATPRPVTRFSYRLIPVEASCNPTLPCMLACSRELCDTLQVPAGRGLIRIGVSFAVKNNTTVQKERNYMKAAIEASLPKNRFAVFGYWNTNWQKGAATTTSATNEDGTTTATTTEPAKFLIEVDAILHIFVAHSTCCMGLQRHLTVAEGRRMYNLHDFGSGTMELNDTTGAGVKKDAVASAGGEDAE